VAETTFHRCQASRRTRTPQTGPLSVEVSSNAEYAAALEFGTSKMAERPYMRPATQRKRAAVVAKVRAAVNEVTARPAK
jgi:HK97 gp10 family phage protein